MRLGRHKRVAVKTFLNPHVSHNLRFGLDIFVDGRHFRSRKGVRHEDVHPRAVAIRAECEKLLRRGDDLRVLREEM